MPHVIIALLVIAAVFGMGRCSAPDPPERGYDVIEVEKEVVRTEIVPGATPYTCKQAADLLPRLVESLEGIDIKVGQLALLADELATFAEQPGGQVEINKRIMEANDLQERIAAPSMAALETSQNYTRLAETCKEDMSTG